MISSMSLDDTSQTHDRSWGSLEPGWIKEAESDTGGVGLNDCPVPSIISDIPTV